MNTRKKTQFMTMTALLTAIAILIPIVMPFKIVIPPASYTLGSHIAIFIAMFLSPCLLYTSPSPRDPKTSRMPSSA